MGLSTDDIVRVMQLKGVGRKTLFRICEQEFTLTDMDLVDFLIETGKTKAIPRFPEFTKSEILEAFSEGERILAKSDQANVLITSFYDKAYPAPLKEIPDPPLIINTRGNIELLASKVGVAVIGTREPSPAGFKVGVHVGKQLGTLGYNVVSGLAVGCDSAGHRGCLEASGITTAILAHGLHMTYPKQNKDLAESIFEKGGVLLTEYLYGTGALANYFVERDRLQSGLSKATIVIQTDEKGGTMHAVNATIKSNKKLAAIKYKGDELLYSKTKGNELLIREGKAFPLSSENLAEFLESFDQKELPVAKTAISQGNQTTMF